jgi:hypothetical protein
MVENDVKAELFNELDNSDNVIEHYPTIRHNDNDQPVNELLLFYSNKPIFKNKIYVLQLDRLPVISSYYPVTFEARYIDKAVTYLVEKHHEITNMDTDDIELNIKLIENDMHITQLYFSEKSLRYEIDRISLLIDNLK